MARGGCFFSERQGVRSAFRMPAAVTFQGIGFGIRVARTIRAFPAPTLPMPPTPPPVKEGPKDKSGP